MFRMGGEISSLRATPWSHPGQGGGDTGAGGFQYHSKSSNNLSKQRPAQREGDTWKQMNKQDQLWWG